MLGVQRSTVHLVTCGLQSTGSIHQISVINVTDGSGVEQLACGCYESRDWGHSNSHVHAARIVVQAMCSA